MGSSNSLAKAAANTLPTHIILKRMDECILPDEREVVLDYMEMLELKLSIPKTIAHISNEFLEQNGVALTLKILIRLIKDPIAVRVGLNLIEIQTFNVSVISAFIQFGGLDFMYKVMAEHEKDDYLSLAAPKFLKTVLALGATAAINEIKDEGISLQLCVKCQETMARTKNIGSSLGRQSLPKSSQRVNRVLMFMENYIKSKNVQCTGMDALIYFSRNADCYNQISDTRTIEVACKILQEFKSDKDVVWRACIALSNFANLNDSLGWEIAQFNSHNIVAECFHLPEFEKDFRIQQQILWLLDSMMKSYKAKRRIHTSITCMELFKELDALREKLIREKAHSATDRFKPYEIVMPVRLREFLRETKGEVSKEVVPDPPKRKFKKRRNFDEKPRFGNIDSDFSKGEKGLVDD